MLNGGKCFKLITGCETNAVKSGQIECSKCQVDYHLINKSCQKKNLPSNCKSYDKVTWKNNVDVCTECALKYFLRDDKCFLKIIFCGKQAEVNGVETCKLCDFGFNLKDGKCS